jgi:hypothetical protein
MIKIRYRDPNELSPGLHAAAERHGRNTTVYLLSGLSAAQRRAVLRRLRISGRRGYDPRLPAPQLALALLADRIRTTFARAGAVFRSHPAGSTVPVMVISAGAIAFLALSAVSIQVIHHPRNPGPLSSAEAAGVPGAGPSGSVRPGSRPGQSPGPVAAGLADPGQPGSAASDPTQPGSGAPGSAGSGHGNGNGSGTDPSASTGPDPSTGTTPSGSAAPTPSPAGDPTTATTAAPAGGEAATSATTSKPSSTPAASTSGLCLNLGPLGLCL